MEEVGRYASGSDNLISSWIWLRARGLVTVLVRPVDQGAVTAVHSHLSAVSDIPIHLTRRFVIGRLVSM